MKKREKNKSKLRKLEKEVEIFQKQLQSIIQKLPNVDKDNIRHTLLLLQEKPIERLRRGLLRAQKFNFYR